MVYPKISNEVGRADDCRAFARQLSFLPTKSDIVDIQQHCKYSDYLSTSYLFVFISSKTRI